MHGVRPSDTGKRSPRLLPRRYVAGQLAILKKENFSLPAGSLRRSTDAGPQAIICKRLRASTSARERETPLS
jgi:hypothetical protein